MDAVSFYSRRASMCIVVVHRFIEHKMKNSILCGERRAQSKYEKHCVRTLLDICCSSASLFVIASAIIIIVECVLLVLLVPASRSPF